MYNLEYLDNFLETSLPNMRELIMINNGTLLCIGAIFFINYIIKLFIFKENKIEVKKNLWNIVKLISVYALLGSITALYTLANNFDKPFTSSVLMDTIVIMICLLIGYFAIVGLIYALYPNFLRPKLKKVISITILKTQEFCKPRFEILKDELKKRKIHSNK